MVEASAQRAQLSWLSRAEAGRDSRRWSAERAKSQAIPSGAKRDLLVAQLLILLRLGGVPFKRGDSRPLGIKVSRGDSPEEFRAWKPAGTPEPRKIQSRSKRLEP